MKQVDVLIIGAGAAGLLCAVEAGKRGRRVLVVDHGPAPGVVEPGRQGGLMAEVPRQANRLHLRRLRRQRAGLPEGSIRASVVDEDELAGLPERVHHSEGAPRELVDDALFVEYRHDYGVFYSHRYPLP